MCTVLIRATKKAGGREIRDVSLQFNNTPTGEWRAECKGPFQDEREAIKWFLDAYTRSMGAGNAQSLREDLIESELL